MPTNCVWPALVLIEWGNTSVESCLIGQLPGTEVRDWFIPPLRAMLQKAALSFCGERGKSTPKELDRHAVNQRAEQILGAYGDSILRYAYSYLHNMSDAEEILQDTLIQFLKSAPVFDSRQHEKAWLLRVAGNLSKNRIAYNAVRKADELNDELVADNREDLSFVWDAVKNLPSRYREVVHLYYHEGYSTKQIAALLQKNEATVRSDLYRGRAKLKEILKEAYDFEETV